MRVGQTGLLRVLSIDPRAPVATHEADPAAAATRFLADHRDAFQLGESEIASFAVTRIDRDPKSDVRHVTLQRLVDGDPVFQGAITVHMNRGNDVFNAVGDDFYRVSPPTNRKVKTALEAAHAAARAFGLDDGALSIVSSERQRTVLRSPRLVDAMHVTPSVLQLGANDSRFVHQVTLGWNDEDGQLQYQLVLIDAESGELLQNVNLVDTYTGRVFTASPGAVPADDGRVLVSFDGDPAASPQGWVGAARTTIGNNAVAATDLDGDNRVGTNETQPIADANDSFDFPFSSAQDAASFRTASVANAFYLVNDLHDRTYRLGFTETAGNFQTDNFGKGGAQNDEVQVDAQDGSGTDNANFATPPDGSRPRMQMFLFNIAHGDSLRQDGDFDATVIYHELTHGLSNRLVGGGTTGCLVNLQSGGMGEGWGDFMAASFLDDPVIGAYVTGNATVGIRRASMANSPFTYTDIQDRQPGGDPRRRRAVGGRPVGRPHRPRPGRHRGARRRRHEAHAVPPDDARARATRSSRPTSTSTAAPTAARCGRRSPAAGWATAPRRPTINRRRQIVTSTEVPSDCVAAPPGTTRTFDSTDVPKAIPDYSLAGVRSHIDVTETGLDIQKVVVNVDITHTYRGDLMIQVVAPNGQTAVLSNRQGGSADNFVATDLDITSSFRPGSAATGVWRLFVRDVARQDVGTINAFSLDDHLVPLSAGAVTASYSFAVKWETVFSYVMTAAIASGSTTAVSRSSPAKARITSSDSHSVCTSMSTVWSCLRLSR